MNVTATATYPLGTQVLSPVYRPLPAVIGEVEQAPAGNAVLRVGRMLASGGWTQTGHIVLTPAERDVLIDALTAQRDAEAQSRP